MTTDHMIEWLDGLDSEIASKIAGRLGELQELVKAQAERIHAAHEVLAARAEKAEEVSFVTFSSEFSDPKMWFFIGPGAKAEAKDFVVRHREWSWGHWDVYHAPAKYCPKEASGTAMP